MYNILYFAHFKLFRKPKEKVKMVLFHNISVGQRVEVKLGLVVFRGTVKYKGPVINKKGEWVGISLDHSGNYRMCTNKPTLPRLITICDNNVLCLLIDKKKFSKLLIFLR